MNRDVKNKMPEILIPVLKYILLISALIYISVPLFITSRLYYPSRELFSVDISYEDIFIPVEENVKINAWYSPPQKRNITVLFCHGNGGNLSFYTELIRLLQQKGYGVMAIDYRGYGKSTGKPYENGLYNDLRAAVNYLKENKNTPEEKIVLWGLSLGGAVVAQIASETPSFSGVILQSTFTSIRDMANYVLHRIYLGIKSDYDNYFSNMFIENAIMLNQEYKTKDKVSRIKSRLLLAHAIPDNIVPFEMTVKLSDLNPKAEVFISREGGHNEHSWFYPRAFEFLGSLSNEEKENTR